MSDPQSNLTFASVISNLNQTKFIRIALESIKYQNININVALMDGGSQDNIQVIPLRKGRKKAANPIDLRKGKYLD